MLRTIFGQCRADEEAYAPAEQSSLSQDKIGIFSATNTQGADEKDRPTITSSRDPAAGEIERRVATSRGVIVVPEKAIDDRVGFCFRADDAGDMRAGGLKLRLPILSPLRVDAADDCEQCVGLHFDAYVAKAKRDHE